MMVTYLFTRHTLHLPCYYDLSFEKPVNDHAHMATQRPTGMWLLSDILESRLEKQMPEMFHSFLTYLLRGSQHTGQEGKSTPMWLN